MELQDTVQKLQKELQQLKSRIERIENSDNHNILRISRLLSKPFNFPLLFLLLIIIVRMKCLLLILHQLPWANPLSFVTSYIPPTAFRQTSTSRPPLPSSEIEKEKLIPPEHTLQLFAQLKSKSKIGTLAVKLSRESFFGVKVIKLCTVAVWRGLPALPVVELGQLKEFLFKQLPDYWHMPTEFEPLWSRCINQCCEGLCQGNK